MCGQRERIRLKVGCIARQACADIGIPEGAMQLRILKCAASLVSPRVGCAFTYSSQHRLGVGNEEDTSTVTKVAEGQDQISSLAAREERRKTCKPVEAK